jgi:hypothetical protein
LVQLPEIETDLEGSEVDPIEFDRLSHHAERLVSPVYTHAREIGFQGGQVASCTA